MTESVQEPVAGRAPHSLQRYAAAWRWHFWAGVVVIPFLLVLATTGLVMLYYTAVQTPLGERLTVAAQRSAPISPERQLAAAQGALPGATAAVYVPASSAKQPALFELLIDDKAYAIDIDPYTGEVLRVVDKDTTLYALAHRIHGTLMLGDVGDTVVEVVAGLALLMLATGLYMWLHQRAPAPATHHGRSRWQRGHRLAGLYTAALLCFFLLSGLAWTDVWGGKLVQAWGSFPAQKWGPIRLSDTSHNAMNHGAHKAVPWGLEQTPLPASAPGHNAINLDAIVALARKRGFGPRYRVNLPRDENGVYTISTTSMNGETDRPGDERTVHVDRHSGEVLAEVGFDDYSGLAKSMAVGVSVHQGSLGWWSIALDAAACLAIIFLCISGSLMWWLRRPARAGWLPVPPRSAALPLHSSLTVLLLVLGITFPLSGAALLGGVLISVLLARRRRRAIC